MGTMTEIWAHNRALDADLRVIGTYKRSGLRYVYEGALDAFAELLKGRIKSKRQNIIAVVGPTGSGKSTVAIQLCRMLDKNFSIRDNYIYDLDDLKDKLKSPGSSPINLFDEGSVSLNSNNSMKKEDKRMVVLFDTMRSLGWTSIICIPSIESLNKRVREFHVDYLLRCPVQSPIKGMDPRGFVMIYKHTLSDWGKPYWSLVATTVYDKLPSKIDQEYQRIKLDHQMRLIQEFIKDEDD